MYKMMIVDDEYMILEGMKRLLDYSSLGLDLVYTCDRASEALAYAQDHPVDVLLTDITMPEMSGLSLIKAIKTLKPDIETIIMSGFQEFEYARKAVSLGVKDYLVKPINKKELQAILEAIVHQKNTMGNIGKDFLKGKGISITQLQGAFDTNSIYFVASLEAIEGTLSQVERHIGKRLLYFSLATEPYPPAETLYQIGLDEQMTIETIEQAVEYALFYGVTEATDHQVPTYTSLQSFITSSDLNAILDKLPELERGFTATLPKVSISKQFFIQLLVDIFAHFNRKTDDELERLYLDMNRTQTLQELIAKVRHQLEQLIEEYRFNSHVKTVLDMIRDEYQEDLTLKQVSERLFLNPVYLGQIIKKETGASFSELLNEERIKAAQGLLLSSDMSIEDICFHVGYNNVGYFYKIFKRIYQESPKSYREKLRRPVGK